MGRRKGGWNTTSKVDMLNRGEGEGMSEGSRVSFKLRKRTWRDVGSEAVPTPWLARAVVNTYETPREKKEQKSNTARSSK